MATLGKNRENHLQGSLTSMTGTLEAFSRSSVWKRSRSCAGKSVEKKSSRQAAVLFRKFFEIMPLVMCRTTHMSSKRLQVHAFD